MYYLFCKLWVNFLIFIIEIFMFGLFIKGFKEDFEGLVNVIGDFNVDFCVEVFLNEL